MTRFTRSDEFNLTSTSSTASPSRSITRAFLCLPFTSSRELIALLAQATSSLAALQRNVSMIAVDEGP